ncbi:LysR family transcriptional regulator [Nonomuraea antimicrobica]
MTADLDLGAVRAFVAVTEDRYFSEAAARLGISQQAVSKRVAKLESDLGLRLFFRTRNGADLTSDGRAFLHYARALVGLGDQALEALRGRRRSLRVDVLDTRLVAVDLVRAFHQGATDADVEVVTSNGLRSALGTLSGGSVDAAFARVRGALDEDLRHVPAYLEPVHLLVGRDHPSPGWRRWSSNACRARRSGCRATPRAASGATTTGSSGPPSTCGSTTPGPTSAGSGSCPRSAPAAASGSWANGAGCPGIRVRCRSPSSRPSPSTRARCCATARTTTRCWRGSSSSSPTGSARTTRGCSGYRSPTAPPS